MNANKPSQFNVISDEISGRRYVFNTLTHNLALMSQAEVDALSLGIALDPDAEALGYLVHKDHDEASYALWLREAVKDAPDDILQVTIVPGLACNYSCSYCYNGVGHQAKKVAGVFERALDHIQDQAKSGQPVHVTWYGGEPLLYIKPIEKFTQRVRLFLEGRGCLYSCDILTNASLVTEVSGKAIAEIGANSVQVSIDWPLNQSQRHLTNQSADDALQIALSNINKIPEHVDVTIRINAFPGFLEGFEELVKSMQTLIRRRFEAYIHRIHRSNHPDHVESSKMLHIAPEEYHLEYIRALDVLEARGLSAMDMPTMNEHGVCMAQVDSKVVIGPFEGVRKCIREVYGEGATIDEKGSSNSIATFYRHSRIALNSPCRDCSFLPICGGGCVKEQLETPEQISERCTPWKFVLKDRLTRRLERELELEA